MWAQAPFRARGTAYRCSPSLGLNRVQSPLMRFVSRIDLYLPADIIERSPMAWDKLQSLWTTVDLQTDRVRNKVEAVTIVYDFRRMLDDLGIDNARSLVIDGETVFHDQRGEPGDLPSLILALSEHTAIFGSGAQELRLSVEHEEAGLRLVCEVTVVSEYPRGAAAARVSPRWSSIAARCAIGSPSSGGSSRPSSPPPTCAETAARSSRWWPWSATPTPASPL